jgi:arylesterase/paraoxonase
VKKSLRPALIGLGILGLALLLLAIDVARFAGEFHEFEARFPGRCSTIALGGSAEDVQVDRERGVAYLSILDRAAGPPSADVTGSVMLLDLNLAEPAPRAALAFDPPNFHPHGLSLLRRAGEPLRLFAISHWPDGSHSVEVTEQSGGAFFPKQTIRDPALVNPNALVAVGPREFYLVNSTDAAPGSSRLREFLLRQGRGSLVYFDGHKAHVLEQGLGFPAGIAASPDGTRLYVGEGLHKQLRIYSRDPSTGTLKLEEIVDLGTAPDNLNVDDDGVVWIAAHPKLFAFVRHAGEPARRAPTQVLRFDPRQPKPAAGENDSRLIQVYGNDGAEISAGSVGARWRSELIIGAVLDPKVLICRPPP